MAAPDNTVTSSAAGISTLEGAFKSLRPDLVCAVAGLEKDVASMRNFERMMAANEKYAASFNKADAPLPPARRVRAAAGT